MAGGSPKAQDISHNARLICQRATARVLALLLNIVKEILRNWQEKCLDSLSRFSLKRTLPICTATPDCPPISPRLLPSISKPQRTTHMKKQTKHSIKAHLLWSALILL